MLYISSICAVHLSLPQESINSIEGILVYDSSFSASDNQILNVFMKNVYSIGGQSATSSGLVAAIGKDRAVITSGLKIRLFGHFTDSGLFIYDSYQVTDRSLINTFRAFLIERLEKRLLGNEVKPSDVLSMMLITGRCETYSNRIKSLASSCGCMHVLALSGMHLHTVTLTAKPIKNKYIQYFVKTLLVGAFIFIAGPRASLVRSAIFIMLSFLPIYERLTVAYIVHILLFPLSMANIGTVYGYLAVFALILTGPFITSSLSYYVRPYAAGILGSSFAVICLNAPVQLITTGMWQPAAIIAGPLSSACAMLSMTAGFIKLVIGQNKVLDFINSYIYSAIMKIFEIFGCIPKCSYPSYLVFLALCIGIIVHKVKIR